MIKGFRCADTQSLFETGKSRRFAQVADVAMRKLAQLHALMDEFDRAYIAFQQASNLDPDNLQDAYYAAQMASLLKRPNACQRWLDRVLERDGQHRDALLLQEHELRRRGEEERANEVRTRLDKLPA